MTPEEHILRIAEIYRRASRRPPEYIHLTQSEAGQPIDISCFKSFKSAVMLPRYSDIVVRVKYEDVAKLPPKQESLF